MKIQIITIGNELLEGRIVNTNCSFLCQKLYEQGYLAKQQISILDDPKVMLKTFEDSLKNFDVTICSGGLGPTLDDRTLKVACTLFKTELVFDPNLEVKLKKLIKHVNVPNLSDSCYVPKKAELFSNHVGMAPGYILKKGKKRLILLPGVPHEFQHLVIKELIPLLKKEYPPKLKEHKSVIHLCKVPESGIAPYLEELHKKHSKIDFGIYPHLGVLSIHVKCQAKTKKEALTHINPVIRLLRKKYPLQYFDEKYGFIEEALHHFFILHKISVSFAESCSGGSLTAQFTKIPDASKYLTGSLVAYQNEIKQELLGVSKETLKTKGAVSSECAAQMALGANKLFKTDFSIATTGIAGPSGGSAKKPVGTVYVAIAYKNKILFNKNLKLRGSRETIIRRTILYALAEFWMIRDNIPTSN